MTQRMKIYVNICAVTFKFKPSLVLNAMQMDLKKKEIKTSGGMDSTYQFTNKYFRRSPFCDEKVEKQIDLITTKVQVFDFGD